MIRLIGREEADRTLQVLLLAGLVVIPVSAERAERAAHVKSSKGIGFADCFGVELASSSTDHILVNADYGPKSMEDSIHIEFLPPKSNL